MFLARTLKPASVRQYMNIIRILHLERGLSNPLENNFAFTMIMRGIDRQKGTPPKQKLPITPAILCALHQHIEPNDSFQATFWAVCTLAFATFCRKSTLLLKTLEKFQPEFDICQRDVVAATDGFIINIKRTKTIQFRQRVLQIPVVRTNHTICPVSALENMKKHVGAAAAGDPLFTYKDTKDNMRVLTQELFSKTLSHFLEKANITPHNYSGHSFRRGGACFAFANGVPANIIKAQGDWKSNCWERYVDVPLEYRWHMAKVVSEKLCKQGL